MSGNGDEQFSIFHSIEQPSCKALDESKSNNYPACFTCKANWIRIDSAKKHEQVYPTLTGAIGETA